MPKLFESFHKHSPKEWENAAIAGLKGSPLTSLESSLPGDIALKAIYHPLDAEAPAHTSLEEHPNPRESSWQSCQEMEAISPAAWNKLCKADSERQETHFSLRLDAACRRAFTPGQPDTWRPGVSIRGVDDLSVALNDIPHNSTLMVEAGLGFSFFHTLWKDWSRTNETLSEGLSLEIHVDLIEIAALVGQQPFAFDAVLRELAKALQNKEVRLKIASTLWAENGLDSAKELALLLASANYLLPPLFDAGISVETLLNHTLLECGLNHRIFLQIAKQRALRLLWASFTEAFGVDELKRSATLMTRALRRYQTRQDPWTNLLRSSLQGFAAAVGQTEAMHLSTLYEGLGRSDSFERRLAANSQVILKEEALLDKVQDPARGSWYIESLTETIAQKAWTHFQTIEKAGGLFTKKGQFQPIIREWIQAAENAETARLFQSKDILVGTNRYPNSESIANSIQPLIEMEPASRDADLLPDWPLLPEGENGSFFPRRAALSFELLFDQCSNSDATIWLSCLGDTKEHKGRRDFCSQLFSSVGIPTPTDDGHEDMEAAAQAAFASGSTLCLICGRDDRYEEKVPDFISALRKLEAQAQTKPMPVWLAGRPKALLPLLTEAGVEQFVHLTSDLFELCQKLMTPGGK